MKSLAQAPFLSLRRREILAGLAGAALLAGRASSAPSGPGLKASLERAAGSGDPAAMLESLARDGTKGLGPIERAIREMVVHGLERDRDLRRRFPFGKADGSSPYVLSQRHGTFLEVAGKSPTIPLARRLDEETDRLRAEAARGIAPPLFMLDSVIAAERRIAASAVDELRAALSRQIAALESLRAGAAREPGAWRLPHGQDYYALRLRCATNSDITPAQFDRLVLAETGGLLDRADRLFRRLGLGEGSVGARYRALKRRPTDLYANDGPGRDRAVSDMNRALDRVRPHLATWFNPPLELESRVTRMSPAEEQASKRGYRDAPARGKPGTYFPDLASVRDRPRWTLVTVAHHETIPGHMIQLRRQSLADPHPLQLRYAAGYSEGWAIYAESLVARLGLLSPVEQLGYIQSVLFRLARATADIGLHLHRWDRPRALRYLQETVGFELFFPFDVEVDRYCAEPAGFAGDALAAIALRRLGAARVKMGPTAMRDFHDAVLNHGPLSVEALEAVVRP